MSLFRGVAAGLLFWALAPSFASASCAAPPAPLATVVSTSPVVFVGTVERTQDGGTTAIVRVESVWRGPALPARVVVHGSPERGAAATSVDRHFSDGTRYLFVPVNSAPPFEDNSCSATRAMTASIAQLAPPDATSPDSALPGAAPAPDGAPLVWLTAAALAAMAVAALAWLAWRRRSQAE